MPTEIGNFAPVTVPRRNLAFLIAHQWIFDRKMPASDQARRALALYGDNCLEPCGHVWNRLAMSIPPFARAELRKWHTGAEWRLRTTTWLDELACKYGKENFRLRKGPGGPDVKIVCEELLPMVNLLHGVPDLREWQGSLAPPGAKADAWLRASPQHLPQPVQIVGAFNGAEFAKQMKKLNVHGRTDTQATSAIEIEGVQNEYVVKAIEKKKAKGYPPRLLAASRH